MENIYSKYGVAKKFILAGVAGLMLAGPAQALDFSFPDSTTAPASAAFVIPDPAGIPSSGGVGVVSAQVPEPATVALAAIGVVSLLAFRRRKI